MNAENRLRILDTVRRMLVPCLVMTLVALTGCENEPSTRWQVAGGDVESGARMIEFYGCGSCHHIPGINGADGVVGPPLDFWGRRGLIAGTLPNNPDNLIRWIMDPHTIEPGTAMPDVGATEAEARDMAAYLFTLD